MSRLGRIRFLVSCILSLACFPFAAGPGQCASYEADYKPWSGYWWPMSSGEIVTGNGYNGFPSPLEKYDYVTSGVYNGPATQSGRKRYYKPSGEPWEGLCFNWAAASILEEEPVHKGIFQGTVFNIGDKKGLLTVAYDGVLYNEYSTRTPAKFHQVLETFIRDQRTPIMMDLGTDGEVWFYPVFKYDTEYTQSSNVRHYTTTIYYANDAVKPDYVGTFTSRSTYTYYFVLGPLGDIVDSGWEGDSVGASPVRATEPYGTVPANPGIAYDQVKWIVAAIDDPYAGNRSAETGPILDSGGYRLLALDTDFFKVDLSEGDELSIQVYHENDAVSLRFYSPHGPLLKESLGSDTFVIKAGQSGAYLLEITPTSVYEYEPEYELYLQRRLAYQAVFPINPSGLWRNALALSFLANGRGRAHMTIVDPDGFPRTSYMDLSASLQLSGGLEDTFDLQADDGYIRIDSDTPFEGLQIAVSGESLMMGGDSLPVTGAAAEIFYPHFARNDGWKTYFGLINIGDQTERIVRQAYGASGEPLSSDLIELEPGAKFENDTYYMGILGRDARCVSAATKSGRSSLMGYITFMNPSFASRGRDVVPLQSMAGSNLLIPHVASDEHWRTGIAVMNIGREDSPTIFVAYDAAGNWLATSESLLKVRQNLVRDIPGLFPVIAADRVASVKVASTNDQPLTGFVLYESSDRIRLASIPLRPPSTDSIILPHIACADGWWTGIGVTNAGSAGSEVAISIFDENGNKVAERRRFLYPNQRLCHTVRDLFDTDMASLTKARYLKIQSDSGQPLSGIYLMGRNGGQMMGGSIH